MSLKTPPQSSGVPDSSESVDAVAANNHVMMMTEDMDLAFAGAWDSIVSSTSVEGDLDEFGWNDLGHGTDIATAERVNVNINTPVVELENPDDMQSSIDPKHEIIEDTERFVAKSEVIYEFDLPVISSNFEEQWQKDVFPTTDPFQCFNPLDVEGKELVKQEEPEVKKALKRPRPILPKLIMPTPIPAVKETNVLTTPAVDSVLKKNVDQSGFDLLEFVTNKELPINDPTFLSMIGDINPSPVLETSQPTGKKSGGKRKKISSPKTRTTKRAKTVNDHSYNFDSASDNDDDVVSKRYRRMRDLNNLASKRCRANRKKKFDLIKDDEQHLMVKNAELKMRCKHMEDLVAKLKGEFISKVSNPSRKAVKVQRKPLTLDLDELLEMKLESLM